MYLTKTRQQTKTRCNVLKTSKPKMLMAARKIATLLEAVSKSNKQELSLSTE